METDVVVVGLGYTGLATAVAAARAGRRVVGLDSSAARVAEIVAGARGCGRTAVPEDELAAVLTGPLQVRSGPAPEAAVHVLCVPGGDVVDAVDTVACCLRHGDLVIVQSTCPPGMIEEAVIPRLRRLTHARIHLVHSPVRLDPGGHTMTGIPRVVAATTPEDLAVGIRFLERIGQRAVPVSSIRAAELTKVFENTFRLVNISLSNELAALARKLGVDVREVLDAAESKPFGFLRHDPGPGAGGACVPVCAELFAGAANRHGLPAATVEAAIAANDAIPRNIVRQLRLREGRVLVAGVTYKPDVADVRRSAAVRMLEELKTRVTVAYHDPYVPRLRLRDGTVLQNERVRPGIADIVLLVTRHRDMDVSGFDATVVDCSGGFPAGTEDHGA